ncbi:P-loop NTPase fold protein [Peribacillus asahii]|uniref:P-loop NTPase fold protein n=1 Tax=Peribacillus asahii TaxID=228899 RepID=UPI0038309C1E
MDIIKETVLDYVSKPSVNNAILIKGQWGSGKTFYWNNVLAPSIEDKLKDGKLEEKDVAVKYISLYGLDSIEGLQKEIFSQFINFKNAKEGFLKKHKRIKKGKLALNAAKFVLQGAGNYLNIGNGELKMDFNNLVNLKDIVICFDDLERTTIDIEKVLGYINTLVEHSGVKVILLAHEEEIELEKYKEIKEKIIGKTLLYELNVENVISQILISDLIENQILINDLERNKTKIIEVFEQSGSNNLRILIQSLGDIESIYNVAGEEIIQGLNDSIKDSLIIFTLALSFAVKTNQISTKLFESTSSSQDFDSQIIGAKMMERHKKNDGTYQLEPILEFSKNFLDRYDIERKFFKCSELLVCQARLDSEKIKGELNFILQIQDSKPSNIDLLFGLEEIPDNKVNEIVDDVLTQIENGQVSLSKYSYCLEIILMLIKEKIIQFDEQQVYEKFLKGIDSIRKNGSLTDSFQIYNNLSQSNEIKIKEINTLIQKTYEEMKSEHTYKKQFDFYRSAFKSETRTIFLQEFHRNTLQLPSNIISPDEFFNEGLVKFTNKELRQFNMSLRVRFKNFTNMTNDEKQWLNGLKTCANLFLQGKEEKKLSYLFIEETIKTIDELEVN